MEDIMNKQKFWLSLSLRAYIVHCLVVMGITIYVCYMKAIPDTIDRLFFVDSVSRLSRLLTWIVLFIRASYLWREQATPKSNPKEYVIISLILIAEVALLKLSRLLAVYGL